MFFENLSVQQGVYNVDTNSVALFLKYFLRDDPVYKNPTSCCNGRQKRSPGLENDAKTSVNGIEAKLEDSPLVVDIRATLSDSTLFCTGTII